MQWMTEASLVPCHALRVPQHVAVSLSEPLNQMISSAPSTETVFALVLFLNNLFLDEKELHLPFLRFCLETCKLLGGLSTKTNEFPLPR